MMSTGLLAIAMASNAADGLAFLPRRAPTDFEIECDLTSGRQKSELRADIHWLADRDDKGFVGAVKFTFDSTQERLGSRTADILLAYPAGMIAFYGDNPDVDAVTFDFAGGVGPRLQIKITKDGIRKTEVASGFCDVASAEEQK